MKNLLVKLIGFYVNSISLLASEKGAKLALRIFATPRKGEPNDRQKQFLSAAEQIPIYCQDRTLMTYHWPGEKEKILLAHGWESNAARWRPFIEILLDMKYEVIAIDAPAHGQSDGRTFNAILYAACLEEAVKSFSPEVLVGHSVGGMASIFLIHNHGKQSIKKIAMLGAPAHFAGVLDRYISLMGYNGRTATAIENLIQKEFGHEPAYFSAAEFSKTIDVKGLVIHDKNDRIIPYEDALLFESHYQSSRLITTEGLGHGLKDQRVYDEILEFIQT
ncbi:MAG: alpha/beta hydrolase [Flavobacteriaceae bacterium]|nr:alpha/beta hydrolase [Flavobacteriaceae bacterium]